MLQINLFEKDKVIIPVHLGNHWCMAIINFKDKRLEYYDSLGGGDGGCLKASMILSRKHLSFSY